MQKLDALRCSGCGAPLPADSNAQFITCQYCGVSQQRIDAEKYIEQLRTDVYRWVQSMVPVGAQTVTQIDAVARAQIFENSIRDGIEVRLNAMNMQLVTACSNHLLVPPFVSAPSHFTIATSIDPKTMLNESARIQGLSPFAQSDDQNLLLNNAINSSETLGYVSNIMRILSSTDPIISYSTVARNFRSASESLAKDPSRSAGAQRMEGLALANEGIALLISGNFTDAGKKFVDAESRLQDAQKNILAQTSIISWFAGIKSEVSLVESMKIAIDGVQAATSTGLPAPELLKRYERYSRSFERARKTIGGLLHSGDHLDPDTYRELCKSFSEINMAKSGQKPATLLSGGGQLWIACWVVDINYTFATGALFMKKGMMVQDRILLPALFTLNPSRLMQSPEEAVTDVFSLKAPSSYWERMRGKEKSLTQDTGFASNAHLTSANIPSTAPVIPLLSTKFEAERAVNLYLERVRQRLQDKLRIGIPTVSQVIYVSGNVQNGRFVIGSLPESLQPSVGSQGELMDLAI
jgi:hypothetical protein